MAAGERRSYSGNAVTTSPTANFNSAATTFTVADATGYPDGTIGPFFVKVDSEVIKCVGRTGTTFNVQTTPTSGRGWDGTVAASHTTSSIVNFVYSKTDADEANEHYSSIAVDHHTQYLTNARHDLTARHPASILPLGSPGSSAPGDTSSAGVASSVARSDHRHGREPDTTSRKGCSLDATSFSVAPSSVTTISWTSETVDTSGYISPTATTLTIPAGLGGLYMITVTGSWTGVFSEARNVFISTGAVTYPMALATPLSGLGGGYVQNWSVTFVRPFAAGDTLSIGLGHSNAGSQSTTAHLDFYRVAE